MAALDELTSHDVLEVFRGEFSSCAYAFNPTSGTDRCRNADEKGVVEYVMVCQVVGGRWCVTEVAGRKCQPNTDRGEKLNAARFDVK